MILFVNLEGVLKKIQIESLRVISKDFEIVLNTIVSKRCLFDSFKGSIQGSMVHPGPRFEIFLGPWSALVRFFTNFASPRGPTFWSVRARMVLRI